jgi:hypothetical protein
MALSSTVGFTKNYTNLKSTTLFNDEPIIFAAKHQRLNKFANNRAVTNKLSAIHK